MKNYKKWGITLILLVIGVVFVYARESASEVVQQYERIVSSYETWVDMITRRDSTKGNSFTSSDLSAFNNHAKSLNNISDKSMSTSLDNELESNKSLQQRLADCRRRERRATAKFESWYYDYKQCN